MVKDYLATMKRLRERNFAERVGDSYQRQEVKQHWAPMVQSNENVVETITKDLKPIKEEIQNLNKYIIKHEVKHDENSDDDDDSERYFNRFKAKVLARDADVDTSFGLRFLEDGKTIMMGDKVVRVDRDDNIHVENEFYLGTKGLWNLITGMTENQVGYVDEDYTPFDLLEYVKLIKQTSVLHHDFNPDNPRPKANSSWKWKRFLKPLWEDLKNEQRSSSGSGLRRARRQRSSLLQDPVKSYKTYIQKKNKCYRVQTVKDGDGLFLSPAHLQRHFGGNGLFLKRGRRIYDGRGLLLGDNSPLKDIPILGWYL